MTNFRGINVDGPDDLDALASRGQTSDFLTDWTKAIMNRAIPFHPRIRAFSPSWGPLNGLGTREH
jgi:hypothetical protein